MKHIATSSKREREVRFGGINNESMLHCKITKSAQFNNPNTLQSRYSKLFAYNVIQLECKISNLTLLCCKCSK